MPAGIMIADPEPPPPEDPLSSTPLAVARRAAPLLGLMLLVGGCPKGYVDDDPKAQTARQIILDMTTVDGVDVAAGDKVDWKSVTPMDEGEVALKLLVGNPFEGAHGVTGEVVVYTSRAEPVTKVVIEPSKNKYELTWEGKRNETYLVKLEAARGKARYKFDYAQTIAPKDPCALVSCQDGQQCEDGECVAVEEEEEEEQEDKAGCPGGCERGYYCSKARGKCFKNLCYGVTCKGGKRCSRGKCVGGSKPATTAVTKKPDKPADKSPEPSASANTGPISATVVQVISEGSSSIIVLSRGSKHNVKVGDTGKIAGLSFTVRNVYPVRSRAKVNAPAAKLSSTKSCTINRR
jgi:hypothetical protein